MLHRLTGHDLALLDLHSRVLAFLRAVERDGGITRVWQGWGQDRQREFRDQLVAIQQMVSAMAAQVQEALPKQPLAIVPHRAGG